MLVVQSCAYNQIVGVLSLISVVLIIKFKTLEKLSLSGLYWAKNHCEIRQPLEPGEFQKALFHYVGQTTFMDRK